MVLWGFYTISYQEMYVYVQQMNVKASEEWKIVKNSFEKCVYQKLEYIILLFLSV